MTTEVRHKLARALLALPSTFALLWAASYAGPPLAPAALELVYVGQLALRLGLFASALLAVLSLLDARLGARRGLRTPAIVTACCAPYVVRLAEDTAQLDTITRRALPTLPIQLAVGCGGLLAVFLLWQYQRRLERGVFAHGLAMLALGALAALSALIGRSMPLLVPGAYTIAVMLVTVLAHAAIARAGRAFRHARARSTHTAQDKPPTAEAHPHGPQGGGPQRAPLRTAALVSVPFVALGLFGLVAPDHLERGRADLHRRTWSFAHLDRYLMARSPAPRLRDHAQTLASATCKGPQPLEAPAGLRREQRKNLVFISIDSVRADDAQRLHQGKPIMPELSRFIDESVSAQAAYAAYPATMMSLSSAFSGATPSRVMLSATPIPTVFSALSQTHEAVAVLPAGKYFQRKPLSWMLFQGATRMAGKNAQRISDLTIQQLRALRKQGRPHVLWAHYMEPHEPYAQHKGHHFGDSDRARYWSELAYVDKQLGRVLKVLRKEGWYEDSLVFVFSDHGEAFGEHGQKYHHFHLYPWLTRVPFAMHVPGQKPRRIDGPVHLMDIAVTSYHFAGHPSEAQLDGLSLLAAEPARDRPIVSEEFPANLATLERFAARPPQSAEELLARSDEVEIGRGYPSKLSLTIGPKQLVLHRATGVLELYDLARDPGAERNLAFEDRETTAQMLRQVDTWYASLSTRLGCSLRVERSDVARAR